MGRTARTANAVLGALDAALAAPVMYLGGLTVISWCASRRRSVVMQARAPITRFAVLVPAHDEETTIATMLSSMTSQDYPASLFTVHVVADNCSDRTAQIVRAHGAEAHVRDDLDDPGKGPALNWLVQRLVDRDEPFDAAVFIDADTTVAPGFLSALDRRFQGGSEAVQGYYSVREAFDSPPAALRFCALACRHYARPIGRNAIGGSCGLFGNGMAFRRDVVVDRQWTAHLVEDMEFQLELLLAGITVDFEPDAEVEAEMPHTFSASVTQHQRWERGRIEIVRTYLPRLLGRLARPAPARRAAVVDAALDMCVPPLSLLAAAVGASAGAGLLVAVAAPTRASRANALAGIAFVATISFHVAIALRMVRAPRQAYRALLQAPRLAAWKLFVVIRSASGRDGADWIRTRRNAETSPAAGVANGAA